MIGGLQPTAVSPAGAARPVHLVDLRRVIRLNVSPAALSYHLLSQVQCLLPALASSLHDLPLLVELKHVTLEGQEGAGLATHHGDPEHDDKCHRGEADHDDGHCPGWEEVI